MTVVTQPARGDVGWEVLASGPEFVALGDLFTVLGPQGRRKLRDGRLGVGVFRLVAVVSYDDGRTCAEVVGPQSNPRTRSFDWTRLEPVRGRRR